MSSHGHSHNGQPCHGHGPKAPPPQQHGHSHNGQPCHGHGNNSSQHGHSHNNAPAQHGHSHNGQPCHGHGGGDVDPIKVKKLKAIDLFARLVLLPKLYLVFAKYHKSTPEEEEVKKTIEDNKKGNINEHEIMTRSEFRDFIHDIHKATTLVDGHGICRPLEVDELATQMLLNFKLIEKADDDVTIKQPEFIKIVLDMVVRITTVRTAYGLEIFKTWNLDIKIPNFPVTEDEAMYDQAQSFVISTISPVLKQTMVESSQKNKDNEVLSIQSGLFDVMNLVITGLEKSESKVESTIQEIAKLKAIPLNTICENLKFDPTTDKLPNVDLLVSFLSLNVFVPLLLKDADAFKSVVKNFGIDFEIDDEEGEDDHSHNGHSHSHGHGGHGHTH